MNKKNILFTSVQMMRINLPKYCDRNVAPIQVYNILQTASMTLFSKPSI